MEGIEMTNKYVGIIVGSLVHQGIKRGKIHYENLPFYEEVGNELNVVPCYFRLIDIKPGINKVKAYIKQKNGKYKLTVIPKPNIIHNRAFTNTFETKNKIKQLQKEGIIIFNENNRYTKLTVYDILVKNKELIPFIPETVIASTANLKYMMKKYNELILKPNSGSLGMGISKLTRINQRIWELSYYQKKSLIKERFSTILPANLKNLISNPRVIIQQRIPLALCKGTPFDMRVSVQKNGHGEWQISGIVGKVAKKGRFITNVAQGGTCFPLEELLRDLPHLDIQQVSKDIETLSIKVVKQLESKIPNLADLGIDIGITNNGKPMLIECNGRDLRVTFRNANMLDEWKTTHVTPIRYAHYLYKTIKNDNGMVDMGT
jgi:glutathione synthase/RimK-type ligase-like ATP-grasp enzyme